METNEIETRKAKEKINETKSLFLKKKTRLQLYTPRTREGSKSEMKEETLKLMPQKHKSIRSGYYEQSYTNKLDHLEEMN